jgi:glycosyltransferase involved in cell wall biosynthesis
VLVKWLVHLCFAIKMSTAKNIVLITPGFPTSESDYLCMPYLQTFLKQVEKDHEDLSIRIISLQYPYSASSYDWHGIKVFACGGANRPFPIRLFYWRKALNQLSKLHKEKKVDVVHSLWLGECTYLAQRWATSHKVKHVATAMGQDVLTSNRYLNRINLDKLTSVLLSDFQNQELEKTLGRGTGHVIPWGLDAMTGTENPREIDILGVGSFIKLKDYELFLAVIALVVKTYSKLRVTLIGDGPEKARLEQLAKTLNITDNIKFLGEVPRPNVLETMQRSNVFLHTSTYESQGYVLNEALASGMSIVSRKVGLAEASGRWSICETRQEMADASLSLLGQTFEPISIMSVQKTIEGYKRLYN